MNAMTIDVERPAGEGEHTRNLYWFDTQLQTSTTRHQAEQSIGTRNARQGVHCEPRSSVQIAERARKRCKKRVSMVARNGGAREGKLEVDAVGIQVAWSLAPTRKIGLGATISEAAVAGIARPVPAGRHRGAAESFR